MPVIDYFYSAHSAFAWLGSAQVLKICARHGARLVHRPIYLSPVVEAAGGLSFAGRTQAHVDYFFGRDIEHWAEFRGVEVIRHRPTHHDNPLDLPNGVIIAAQEAGQGADALSHAILGAHWRDDADIADAATLATLIAGCGLDPETLLAAARSEPVQAIHAANTAEAIARSVFGSPTYFVDGDPFYGQDRLDLVERALSRPFAPSDWCNPPVG
ncbi:MAG: disulfide bond formation protein DsbA [Rhodobacteraceae bacterium CG17_big_fil_post_rev_8_21_14_2_50_63_15]|nr:2-hydroxychromene-2-carboxylate isomerase [Roseovarius sp.]PIV77207.1 MAG: disulfide bond formation protein DsbA [Rhodobacteraceae bacterium CG17_big_fil_post_rev_8_21_14_2_50_63_15]